MKKRRCSVRRWLRIATMGRARQLVALGPAAVALCGASPGCLNWLEVPAGYMVGCGSGFVIEGADCVDIDECAHGLVACNLHAVCVNTPGAYDCVCNDGWEGDGFECVDIDECTDGSASCDPNATCANTPGAYDCVCNDGWEGDGFECQTRCGDDFCVGDENLVSCAADCDLDLAVVVAAELADELAASLQIYRDDLYAEQRRSRVVVFPGGNVDELKALIASEAANYGIEGVFLVGELPAAWYEMTSFGDHEEFPTDIFFMDHQAQWGDGDNNQRFDSHTDLNATLFVARLNGTAAELDRYFARVHSYRTGGSLMEPSAFVFVDDDWAYGESAFGLDTIYSKVGVVVDKNETTADSYLGRLTGVGTEFLYQKIHSSPTALYVDDDKDATVLHLEEVLNLSVKASFFHLFSCSAARFTEKNFATAFVLRTDYGLAAVGSTKTGSILDSELFHRTLGAGHSWGESYRRWYNEDGITDDGWHLGVVIVGDPMLTVSRNVRRALNRSATSSPAARAWSAEEREALWQTMRRFSVEQQMGGFEEYRSRHPEHF